MISTVPAGIVYQDKFLSACIVTSKRSTISFLTKSSSSNFATYSRLLSWMARKCQLKHSLERFVTLEMSLNSWKYNFIRYCSMGLVHGLQLVGILQASVPLEHLVADRQEEHSSDSWVSLSGRHCDGLQVSNCM